MRMTVDLFLGCFFVGLDMPDKLDSPIYDLLLFQTLHTPGATAFHGGGMMVVHCGEFDVTVFIVGLYGSSNMLYM